MTSEQFQVDFEPIGKRVELDPETSLLKATRHAGIELTSACGGEGHCGQCRVVVVSGEVSEPLAEEEYVLTAEELAEGERLACCTLPQSDLKVAIPRSSLLTNQRLQIAGVSQEVAVSPLIAAWPIAPSPPTLEDHRGDAERVRDALVETSDLDSPKFEPAVVAQIAENARPYAWRMAAYTRGAEVVGIAPPDSRPLGVAVDLGTTKVAAYLIELESGRDLASAGAANPQIGYGEDVISRLVFAHREERGAEKMASLVRATLDEIIGELVEEAGVGREQVADLCIVGNTAMTHLLLQLPVRQLALAPYVAATNAPVTFRARDLGLHTAPGADVYILPCIGGFVGADHVAMIMASDLDQSERVAIGIDIGTNTEIVLARPDRDQLYALSAASGPAFEGAHIGAGMRAAAGAIEAVQLTESEVLVKTIDEAPAVGLCGSGIVDAIAELSRWRLINMHGRFDRQNARVREGKRGPEVVLVPERESGSGRDVVVTQEDVNEIQLAKGAIRGGLDVLLEATDTPPEMVEVVYIAGAFGSYLDLESTLALGLFPHLPNAVYRQIGNAAVVGAKRALVSREERARATTVAEKTKYIELTTHPGFKRRFALGMYFPQQDL
ncbi:MAG: ASKHA domain-containing protein [Candidatus Promineifilaceae bacterium]|nr:ASKHA domain-containing protein [Candidatus Promineifilaceae bacterium]